MSCKTRIQLLDLELAGGETDAPDPQQVAKLWNARVQLLEFLGVRTLRGGGRQRRSVRPTA